MKENEFRNWVLRWVSAFYDLEKRKVEALEILSEAVLEIREILVSTKQSEEVEE